MNLMSSKGGVLWPLASGELGHLVWTTDEGDLVRSSIGQILCTRPGERLRRPGFGCDLRGIFFEPGDSVSQDLAAARVRQALSRWEPRIVVVGVTCTIEEGEDGTTSLRIVVVYRLRSTGRRDRVERVVRG